MTPHLDAVQQGAGLRHERLGLVLLGAARQPRAAPGGAIEQAHPGIVLPVAAQQDDSQDGWYISRLRMFGCWFTGQTMGPEKVPLASHESCSRCAEKLCGHLGAGRRADGLAGGALRLAIGVQPARQDVARAAAWQQRHACGKRYGAIQDGATQSGACAVVRSAPPGCHVVHQQQGCSPTCSIWVQRKRQHATRWIKARGRG